MLTSSASPDRNPVLLIHGIDDTIHLFRKLSPFLQGQGYQTHSLNLIPNNGDLGLDQLAQQVAAFVAQTFSPNRSFDLVGFSMGGIISRYYLQRLGGIERVQRFITVSSPHHGTQTAYLRFNPGAKHMRPHSAFLTDLNQDLDRLTSRLTVTSLWTPLDLMIVPAESSHLPGAENVQIPVALHPWMMTDKRVMQSIAAALRQPLRGE